MNGELINISKNLLSVNKQKEIILEFLKSLDINPQDHLILREYFSLVTSHLNRIEESTNSLLTEFAPLILARDVSGPVTINKIKYTYRETRSGLNRGIIFTTQGKNYKITPNPHDDPWYNNNNQETFYAKIALSFQVKGDEEKWTTQSDWPDNFTTKKINGQVYTLQTPGY